MTDIRVDIIMGNVRTEQGTVCLNCKHHKVSVNSELSEIKEYCKIHQRLKGTCNDFEEVE